MDSTIVWVVYQVHGASGGRLFFFNGLTTYAVGEIEECQHK
jgi:hypothetical protein